MSTQQRELVLKKLEARKRAIVLMRKHSFVASAHPSMDNEYYTLDMVISHVRKGGQYDLRQKGFLNCIKGRVVCNIAA